MAIWPNPLAESRSLWCDKVSDRGTRRSLQGSGEPARFAANNIQLYDMLESSRSMLSYTGNVLGITTCFYSYLQGIFANKTRPLLAPVCITACLVAGEISGQTANQRAFAHIDHKHSVNFGKSVKEMGNILKMTSAFLCFPAVQSARLRFGTLVVASQQSSLTVVLSFDKSALQRSLSNCKRQQAILLSPDSGYLFL